MYHKREVTRTSDKTVGEHESTNLLKSQDIKNVPAPSRSPNLEDQEQMTRAEYVR